MQLSALLRSSINSVYPWWAAIETFVANFHPNKRAYFSKVSLSSRLFQCRLFLLYFANTARKRRVNEEEEERKEARRKKKESKETKNTRLRMAFCFTDGSPFKREASSHWLFPLASLYFCLSLRFALAKFANWEPFLSEIRVVRSI